MSVLTREDKKQFVVQPYRELLSHKSASLLKKEIRYLAQQNGQFIRLFKQPNGGYEAVFSRDPGYLLAETIWQHFDKPNDLIYCEQLPDAENALVVIIRAASILFDAKLPLETLSEELSTLLTLKNKFTIYVYGNIQMTPDQEQDKVVFDSDHVLSFTRLDKPVFPSLQPSETMQLLPVEVAIREQHIGRFTSVAWASLFAVVLIAVLSIWYFSKPSVVEQQQEDPFSGYKGALISPRPSQELAALSADVQRTYTLPGWVTTHVSFAGSQIKFEVHSLGGNMHILYQWAQTHGAQVQLATQGASLLLPVSLSNRPAPTTIMRTDRVTAHVIDGIMQLLPNKAVQITNISSHGLYNTISLTISFQNLAPSTMELLAKVLRGLPIKLLRTDATISTGLLTGTLNLTVLGN